LRSVAHGAISVQKDEPRSGARERFPTVESFHFQTRSSGEIVDLSDLPPSLNYVTMCHGGGLTKSQIFDKSQKSHFFESKKGQKTRFFGFPFRYGEPVRKSTQRHRFTLYLVALFFIKNVFFRLFRKS